MPWQPSPLLAPDGEIVLTAKLRALLNARPESYAQDVYVSNHVPNPRRPRMVIVRRDGGLRADVVDQGRYGIRVWGPSDGTGEKVATDLARLVAALLLGCPDGSPIVSVPPRSMTGPTPVEDKSNQPLRYIVAEVHMRATALT